MDITSVLNAAELYTLRWLILRYVNFTSMTKKEQMGGGGVHTRKKRQQALRSFKQSWNKAADGEKCEIKARIFLSFLRRGILEHTPSE